MASHLRESLEERIHQPPHLLQSLAAHVLPLAVELAPRLVPLPHALGAPLAHRCLLLGELQRRRAARLVGGDALEQFGAKSKALRRHLVPPLDRLARHRVHLRQLGVEGTLLLRRAHIGVEGGREGGEEAAEALGHRRELEVDCAELGGRRPQRVGVRGQLAVGLVAQHRPLVELALRELAVLEEVGVVVRRREVGDVDLPLRPRRRRRLGHLAVREQVVPLLDAVVARLRVVLVDLQARLVAVVGEVDRLEPHRAVRARRARHRVVARRDLRREPRRLEHHRRQHRRRQQLGRRQLERRPRQ